ncbi:hypothetical protein M9Y10_022455 [Tritrichomonas musculus]|uniref:HMG box domain-containing protein n=1 Tax=Tritrichomonas musculus TaxID=1915356 RepID=A0ABR2KSA7_9EUKA
METSFLEIDHSFEPVNQIPIADTNMLDYNPKLKRPPNAFIRFCLENRKNYRSNHPELSNIKISSLLASEWNKMTEEQKIPYKKKAQEEQKKFKEENPEYGYDKAKQKRSVKKSSDFDSKQHFDVPDIYTLVNLPLEQLRTCLDELKAQLIVKACSCQSIQQILQQENDNNFHGIDDIFHTFQSTP